MSLAAVRALHVSTVYPSGAVVCAEDGFDWPCRTTQALDADLAAAPPGDEVDPATADDALADDLATLLSAVGGATAHDLVQAIRDAGWRPAPPAGHEDEAAVERAARPGLTHFVPWGSTAAPCGWQCPRGDRDALPLTDRRRQTTCGACQERMTNWSPGERPPPVWSETAAARGPRTPDKSPS